MVRVDVGDYPKITVEVKDANLAYTDPSTITMEVEDPSGNTNTYTLAGGHFTKVSTGIYYCPIVIDEAGRWDITVVTTGIVASESIYFDAIAKYVP